LTATWEGYRVRNEKVKRFALAAGGFVVALALSVSANAASLRQGSTGQSGAVTGSLPGEVLWTYYQTQTSFSKAVVCPPGSNVTDDLLCNTASANDNIIRLINPNGGANGNLAGAKPQTVCAMIYVFDDDEEMGECCGCPLSSAQLATFSVEQNLTSNWGLQSPAEGIASGPDNGNGALAVVAAAPNTLACLGQGRACNGGCDPTNLPGYSVTTANNLLGSITHSQAVITPRPIGTEEIEITLQFGMTETPLSDDAGGDPTNLIYLQNQCGALVGNGTGGGICNCPLE
jgi:hypothetical protein